LGGLVDGDHQFEPNLAVRQRLGAEGVALGLALLPKPTGRIGDFGVTESSLGKAVTV